MYEDSSYKRVVLYVIGFSKIDARKISADGTEITTKAPELIQETTPESQGHIIGSKKHCPFGYVQI